MSEREVAETLSRIVEGAKTRVVVGMFASNVQRLSVLARIAAQTKRRLCLLGRSVQNQVRAAIATGRLRFPSDLIVPPELVSSLPRERVLCIASGTQAERNSALMKLAAGTHPVLRLDPGDIVVLSSRIIPGNDRPVFDLMWLGPFLYATGDGGVARSDDNGQTWTPLSEGLAGRQGRRLMFPLAPAAGLEAFRPSQSNRKPLNCK